jgi:hypothetical protein
MRERKKRRKWRRSKEEVYMRITSWEKPYLRLYNIQKG